MATTQDLKSQLERAESHCRHLRERIAAQEEVEREAQEVDHRAPASPPDSPVDSQQAKDAPATKATKPTAKKATG